jgi:hypothetical protein
VGPIPGNHLFDILTPSLSQSGPQRGGRLVAGGLRSRAFLSDAPPLPESRIYVGWRLGWSDLPTRPYPSRSAHPGATGQARRDQWRHALVSVDVVQVSVIT